MGARRACGPWHAWNPRDELRCLASIYGFTEIWFRCNGILPLRFPQPGEITSAILPLLLLTHGRVGNRPACCRGGGTCPDPIGTPPHGEVNLRLSKSSLLRSGIRSGSAVCCAERLRLSEARASGTTPPRKLEGSAFQLAWRTKRGPTLAGKPEAFRKAGRQSRCEERRGLAIRTGQR
jgi:hypothetical protein